MLLEARAEIVGFLLSASVEDAYMAEQSFLRKATNNKRHETVGQVIALGELVERSKNSGKHKEAELEAKAQEESANKVCGCY